MSVTVFQGKLCDVKKLSFILCSALLAQTSYATDVALGAGLGTLGFVCKAHLRLRSYQCSRCGANSRR